MAKHLTTGRRGEALAEKALTSLGYRLLARNWRHKHLEVDLIAEDGDTLVFIEVKTRNDVQHGRPYESIDWKKEQKLARAAQIYIDKAAYEGEIRFDVVSVIMPRDTPGRMDISPAVEVIKDAFWPK